MNAKGIVDKFGGQTALAALIGKGQSTIAYWIKSKLIPSKWQSALLELAKKNNITLTPADFMNIPTIEVIDSNQDQITQSSYQSPFAQWPGKIDLGGEELDCYVLNTNQRVISLRAMVKSITNVDSGDLASFIGVSSLKPFIDKGLILEQLIEFSIPGTQLKGLGLTTEHFELICRGYVRALYEKAPLTNRQKEIAIKCAVLTAGLTRIGLDALIDEATGYQYQRAEDALQIKLRAFIAEELRGWEKTFPDELWQEFGRLTKWSGALHSRPKWWGKLVVELIYDTLDPDVAEYLKNNKPPAFVKWHQQLTENLGVRQLVSRCFEVIGMAKTCKDIRDLRQKVAEHYGKKAVQFTLYLPDPK